MEKSAIDKNIITVQMLGPFQIQYQGKTLTPRDIASPMVLKLLAYLLYHHKKPVHFQELIQFLWEDKDLINHKGALKNLMYRLRSIFRKTWDDGDFWVTDGDGYHWKEGLQVSLDVEKWEPLIKAKPESLTKEQRLEALELYKGKFMAECEDVHWKLYVQVYYHSRYISLVDNYCYYLEEQHRYTSIGRIAQRALQIDTMEETFHYWFIYALLKQNKLNQAGQVYDSAVAALYHGESVELSNRMKQLNQALLGEEDADVYSVATLVKKALEQDDQARLLEKEDNVFPTVKMHIQVVHPQDFTLSYEKRVMLEEMEKILLGTMRLSDILIGHNNMQYTLLLINCDLTGSDIFEERLKAKIRYGGEIFQGVELEINKKLIHSRR